MPHDMVASSKWLVRTLLTLHADSPLEALRSGSQSSGWLPSCLSEVPEQLVDWPGLLPMRYWGGPVGETNFWIGFRTPFWGHPQEPVLLGGSKWHLAFLKQGLP